MLFCNIFIPVVHAYDADDESLIPEDAIVLSETEETVYYDINSDTIYTDQAQAVSSDVLFEIKCKHHWFQATNGKIDVSITCTAVNHKARIKKIVGSHKAKDTQSYASESSEVRTISTVPYYRISDYISGKSKFTKGHKIKCTLTYYITLVEGGVLNGGKITNSTTVTIVR